MGLKTRVARGKCLPSLAQRVSGGRGIALDHFVFAFFVFVLLFALVPVGSPTDIIGYGNGTA
jgi:hypothetical protein